MGPVFHRGRARAGAPLPHVVSGLLDQPGAHRATAWKSRRAWALLVVVAILALAADLVSKDVAFRSIGPRPVVITRQDVREARSLSALIPAGSTVVVVPRVLDLTLVLNPGAVFGLGNGMRWLFVAFTFAALVFAVWMFGAWTRPRDVAAHIAIGLLIAGGLGNLFDRLVFGCVRDFLHPLPGVRWPFGWSSPWAGREVWPYVSNVADLWLCIGIPLLMFHLWRHGRHEQNATAAPPPA